MADWDTEFYVKIEPRQKGDYGFASMGNDYHNFNSLEEREKFYRKRCQEIVNELENHYKDFNIKRYTIETNEHQQELENQIDELKDQLNTAIYGLKLFCGEKVSYHPSSEIDATHARDILKELGVEK